VSRRLERPTVSWPAYSLIKNSKYSVGPMLFKVIIIIIASHDNEMNDIYNHNDHIISISKVQ
jgi:hypothetical protein